MIVPGSQDFTAYLGSTFDTIITVYPSNDAQYNWVGPWSLGVNYSADTVVIGTDNQAYAALIPNISINPIGDLSQHWSTPLLPLNLNGWRGYITVEPIGTDELIVPPFIATPVEVQGLQGTIGIKFTPQQSTTPLIAPGTYHHYITMTDPSGNTYYYLNGSFIWKSP